MDKKAKLPRIVMNKERDVKRNAVTVFKELKAGLLSEKKATALNSLLRTILECVKQAGSSEHEVRLLALEEKLMKTSEIRKDKTWDGTIIKNRSINDVLTTT
jgi:hypothetical protein